MNSSSPWDDKKIELDNIDEADNTDEAGGIRLPSAPLL